MTIKTYVSEFQDHLVSFIPLYGQLNTDKASKTDYYGTYKSTEKLLEKYDEDLYFLESNSIEVVKEIDDILDSLENKLHKINVFSSVIKDINTTDDRSNELVTVNPYLLNNLTDWESMEECITLPILSTHKEIKSYSNTITNNRCISRFLLDTKFATKYLNIVKDKTLNIVSISYYNDSKEFLSTTELIDSLNKTKIVVEIPVNTRYITIESIFESNNNSLYLIPLSFNHKPSSRISLPTKKYEYGNVLSFSFNSEIPEGCYVILDLQLIFRDVNHKEVYSSSIKLPINSDKKLLKKYSNIKEDDKIVGVWLEGIYTENVEDKVDERCYVTTELKATDNIEYYTESSLLFKNIKNSKTIEVVPTLEMYSMKKTTITPKIYSITGITKNV